MSEEKKKKIDKKLGNEEKEKKVEEIEIQKPKDKAEEYLNNWKRTQADFENYKKDQAKMMGDFRKFASLDMIMQILPVLDNFNASLEHVPEDQKDNAWVTGIIYIKKQLEDVLKNNGVSEIETKIGDKFNPEIHEAVKSDSNDANEHSNDSNVVTRIVQKGYKIDGKVIRAARVIVE